LQNKQNRLVHLCLEKLWVSKVFIFQHIIRIGY
jgi:hypothetical protein